MTTLDMKIELNADIQDLETYALNHYDAGGHWVYETYGKADYMALLASVGSVDNAKQYLKEYWEITQDQYEDVRNA